MVPSSVTLALAAPGARGCGGGRGYRASRALGAPWRARVGRVLHTGGEPRQKRRGDARRLRLLMPPGGTNRLPLEVSVLRVRARSTPGRRGNAIHAQAAQCQATQRPSTAAMADAAIAAYRTTLPLHA